MKCITSPRGRNALRVLIAAGVAAAALAAGPAALAAPNVVVTNAGATDALTVLDVGQGGALGPLVPPSFAGGDDPYDAAYAPDGKSLYVTRYGEDVVAQYDVGPTGALTAKSPATLPAAGSDPDNDNDGGHPTAIAVSPDGKSLYAAAGDAFQFDVGPGGSLTPKDPASVQPSGNRLLSMVLTPDGRHAYGTDKRVVRRFDVDAAGQADLHGLDDGRLRPGQRGGVERRQDPVRRE